VYTVFVKNITLSADEDLIERARALAQARRTTLNSLFREWLHQVVSSARAGQNFDALMKRLDHVNSGGQRFTRDEMNER
jgi:hypothetical protein